MTADGTISGAAVIPAAQDVQQAMAEYARDNPPQPNTYDQAALCQYFGIRPADLPVLFHAGLPLPDQFILRTYLLSGKDERLAVWDGQVVRDWYAGVKAAATLLKVAR